MKRKALKRRVLKVCITLVLILGLGVMGYAGYQLYETDQTYREGNAVYENLNDRIKKSAPVHSAQTQTVEATEIAFPQSRDQDQDQDEEQPRVYIPEFEIDFEALRSVNKDAAAWLYAPGTVIDYPVMEAEDYYYYLNHLVDGTVNANGSLFIDYNNAPDFSGPLTVIYGHHMKSGAMFGGLKGYKEQAYFDENPYMYLYTDQDSYRIDLMYGCVIAAGQWSEKAFMYEENAGELMEYARQNTTFQSNVEFKEGDRIVALSTCSYEFNDARYVVLGILR